MASGKFMKVGDENGNGKDIIKLKLEKHIHHLIENLYDCVYIADAQGNIIFANQAMAETLGYAHKNEIIGKNLAEELYVEPRCRDVFLSEVKKKGYIRDYEIKLMKKTGEEIIVSTTSNFITGREGDIIGIEGVFRDISERKKEEKRFKELKNDLSLEKKKLERVLDSDREMSSILTLNQFVDFDIVWAVEILGVERCSLMLFDPETNGLLIRGAKGLDEEVMIKTKIKIGESIAGLVAKDKRPLCVENIETAKGIPGRSGSNYKGKSFISAPIKIYEKLVGVVNIADKKTDAGLYGVFNPIDLKILSMIIRQAAVAIENANYFRELEYLSISDPLTGLFNHRYFITRLDQEIHRKIRYMKPLSVLMIDVDDFKSYNDEYGRLEGDRLLKQISAVLKKSTRIVDTVCRYAGDEFAVILPETNLTQAAIVADKIMDAVNLSLNSRVILSIGIAECYKDCSRYDFILKADHALYEAKKSKKADIR